VLVEGDAVDEGEWLASTAPQAMLTSLQESGKLSERKARLFAAACARRVWTLMADPRSRHAVEVAERHADGLVGQKVLKAARRAAFTATKAPGAAGHASVVALNVCMDAGQQDCRRMANAAAGCANSLISHVHGETARWADSEAQCRLLRDLFGDLPFRSVTLPQSVRAWKDGTVVQLAQAVYEERLLPSGHLDNTRLAVLADALEDAGCNDAGLLGHLRGPGPHVRGCWAADLILDKG
jgi:hypothetical protein